MSQTCRFTVTAHHDEADLCVSASKFDPGKLMLIALI